MGWQCFCGFGYPYRANNSSHRLGAAFVFFGGYLFNVVLSAKLLQIVTTPMQEIQAKSIGEIVKGNFQLVADRYAHQKMLQQNQVDLLCT